MSKNVLDIYYATYKDSIHKSKSLKFSARHTALWTNTSWLGITIMCPSGVTFLQSDCYFSDLSLYKPN